MSKMDNLRAMREARYAEAMKRAAAGGAKPATRPAVAADGAAAPAKRAKPAAKKAAAPVEKATDAGTEELCGHRNMGGKSCTREKGHAAKSHRYS